MTGGGQPRSGAVAAVHALAASRFLRFALVGVAGAVADIATLTAVSQGLGVDLYSGRVVSFLIAATTTWSLNRRLTFPDRTTGSIGEWARYLVANGLGGLVNLGVYAMLIASGIVLFARWPQLAVAVGSIAGLLFNFTASQRYVFGNGGA